MYRCIRIKNDNYSIGYEIYNLKLKNTYDITRLLKDNIDKSTNISVRCIDASESKMIIIQLDMKFIISN